MTQESQLHSKDQEARTKPEITNAKKVKFNQEAYRFQCTAALLAMEFLTRT